VRRDGRGHGGGVPTHTYVELTDPPRGVRVPAGVLGSEALVIVLLTVEHDLRSRGIQIVPDRNDATRAVPRRIIRREEQRVVEHRERTALAAGREVRLQPLLLHRAGPARHRGGVVEHDDVPVVTQVEAVVPLRRIARRRPEVAEVAARPHDVVFVVPDGRMRARLVPAPGRVVAVRVIRRAAARVHVVAQHEDAPREVVQDLRLASSTSVPQVAMLPAPEKTCTLLGSSTVTTRSSKPAPPSLSVTVT